MESSARVLRAAPLLLIVACLLSLAAQPAQARVTPLSAVLSNGTFGEFSQTNVAEGHLEASDAVPYEGGPSAKASYEGDGRNGYSRGIWNVHWEEGETITFGAAFYLPPGFISDIQGEVDLMRWDNWPTHPDDTDWGGIGIYGSDHKARLLRFGMDRSSETLVGPFELPEGRWFTLQVTEHFSNGPGAFSEVLLDGQPIGHSSKPNMYGREIERIRFGIVAIAEGAQHKPLDLWFDQAEVRPESTPSAQPDRKRWSIRHRSADRRRGDRGHLVAEARIAH